MMAVAFYTRGTPYQEEAETLSATLCSFGVPHHIFQRQHPGSWARANALNGGVIAEAMWLWPGQTILYLDADARLLAPLDPAVLEGDWDVGLYFLPGSSHAPEGCAEELCSGTMVWHPTAQSHLLLAEWRRVLVDPATEALKGVDQEALQRLLPKFPALKVSRLPHGYCWIDRISAMNGLEGPPVIYHTQASRRLKRKVEGTPDAD